MAVTKLDALLARVEKLETQNRRMETQNRRLKTFGLVLAVVVGTGLLMAAAQDQPPKKPAESNRIRIRDDDGNERGYLTATADGVGLVFSGGDGPRSGVMVGRDGVVLQYLDTTGRPLSGLSVQNNGVSIGFQSSKMNADVGNNAIRNVLGNCLRPSPFLARPEPNP